MKRFTKILVYIMALVLLCVGCLSFTACSSDIRRLEVKVSVYNTDSKALEDKTIYVDLYRHLAPKTVDKILEYVNEGYYSNTIFYQENSSIFMGDLAYEDGEIIQKEIKPEIYGEFDANGTIGSDLVNKEGSVGLWRGWSSEGHKVNGSEFDSGRATWFMPTTDLSDYNNYFCVFAQIDLQNETNKETFDAIKKMFTTDGNYQSYAVYYTGEYDADDFNGNYGLTFHSVEAENYVAPEDLFTAEGDQLNSYNKKTVKVAVYENAGVTQLGAKVVSIKVK